MAGDPITTHCLDTSSGLPASNLRIVLKQCVIENDLDGTSKAQPCAKFGMHFKMTAIHDAYNAGDAAWIANMGSLVEPVTKQEYKDKSKALPPSLFAHNVMQKSIATMHPQFSSASGVLGRMTKSMTSQSDPYRSALYSMAGVR